MLQSLLGECNCQRFDISEATEGRPSIAAERARRWTEVVLLDHTRVGEPGTGAP